MPLGAFLLCLHRAPKGLGRQVFRQLVAWLGFLLDSSPWLRQASKDALMTPVPQGPSRARRIDPRLKAAVAEAAAKGELGRSGRKVLVAIRRILRGKFTFGARQKHQQRLEDRLRLYAVRGRATFHA
eukprot:2532543-Lingulodinium_polyedra.AAC.1